MSTVCEAWTKIRYGMANSDKQRANLVGKHLDLMGAVDEFKVCAHAFKMQPVSLVVWVLPHSHHRECACWGVSLGLQRLCGYCVVDILVPSVLEFCLEISHRKSILRQFRVFARVWLWVAKMVGPMREKHEGRVRRRSKGVKPLWVPWIECLNKLEKWVQRM